MTAADEDITSLLQKAEKDDAATHLAEAVSTSVPETFVGVPTMPRAERYTTLAAVRRLMWQTRLDDAEALVAPHAGTDLGFMLAYTEIGLWRAAMTESAANHDAVRHRIAVLDAHATAAFDRLHPERATRSASTLGWLTGQAAPEHPTAAQLSVSERRLAFVDAAIVGAFPPIARAMLDLRGATPQGIATGAWYLRKAWKAFEYAQLVVDKCAETDEHMRALLAFAVGVFQLAFSMVPPSLKWITELVGFKGDRALAYKLLGSARRNAIIHREATLVLVALKFFFHGEKERAERWLAALRDANAESPIILSLSGSFCRAQGRAREAIAYYERALAFKFDAPQFLCTIRYHMGMCYFTLNEWAPAATCLQYFLDNTHGKVFRPYAAWRLGVAYWHLQQHEKIAPLYELGLTWLRPHEAYDQYAELRMRKWLATRRYDAVELLFDAAEALHEGREDRRALELLDQVAPLLKSEFPARDNFAMLFYLKGACLRRLGAAQSERAAKFLRSAIGELAKTETKPHYAVAYALVNLGELLEEEGNSADARKAWDEAKNLRGFVWERMLTTRVTSNLEKLERKLKPAALVETDDLSE